jgi:hypothetical protein
VLVGLADPTKLPAEMRCCELVGVMSNDKRGKEVASLWF